MCFGRAMTKLAGPVASWGEKECRNVVEEARAMQRSTAGRPIIPPIKARKNGNPAKKSVCFSVCLAKKRSIS